MNDFETVQKNLVNVREVQGEIMSCLSYFQCFLQGLSDGLHAVAFVDNHDNQRGDGVGVLDTFLLTFKQKYKYKLASTFSIILFETQVHHTNCQQC